VPVGEGNYEADDPRFVWFPDDVEIVEQDAAEKQLTLDELRRLA
jgi:hypothetical protein